jgi:hypothetical protein
MHPNLLLQLLIASRSLKMLAQLFALLRHSP